MSDTLDMKINRLPALTWNYLRMNGTKVEGVLAGEEGSFSATLPENIEIISREPEYTSIPGSAGPDMNRLMQAGKVKAGCILCDSRLEEPLRLGYVYEDGCNVLNSLELDVREGAEMTVISDCRSRDDASGTVGMQTKARMGKNSVVRLVQIQRLGDRMTFLNDVGVECAEGARLELIQLVLSGGKTFTGGHVSLSGDRSSVVCDVAYRVRGTSRLDLNYTIDHYGKNSESALNAKGVLRDSAFKLLRGSIDFHRGCTGAVGNEKEDALLIDENVVNQTVPLILCQEENVEGNHGATIGRLNDSTVFYLESRGLPRETIYEMAARGRIESVCRKIPDARTREELEEYLYGGGAE